MIALEHRTQPQFVVRTSDGANVLIDTQKRYAVPLTPEEWVRLHLDDDWEAFTGTPALAQSLEALVAAVPDAEQEREPRAVPYREKLVALTEPVVNLPDISDVKFPTLIGAIEPMKPRRKRRKKVAYKDVTLSRVPTALEEQVLSLTDIPRRFDLEVDQIVDALTDVRQAHVKAVQKEGMAGPQTVVTAALRAATRDVVVAAQARIARYGAFELRRECWRQGMVLALPEESDAVYRVRGLEALVASASQLSDRLTNEWVDGTERLLLRLKRVKRPLSKLASLAEPRLTWGLKGAARQVLHESFSTARQAYIRQLAALATPTDAAVLALAKKARDIDDDEADKLVDYVVQTAILDDNTCENCEELDGKVFDFGDDEQEEFMPPVYTCLGGDACRCLQIFVLKDGSTWEVRDGVILP